MFLKRIEVVGFKSFAEKINIEFDQGFTAVVGPNGSGKSNISDGIRWVLGEQSAKSLRGEKMEDIIFAGSELRQPLNFAEVTLILDNADQYLAIDYLEVSVTRRVYRSGESEYFLNKQPCRLKDITDLFIDSGLGKGAYSIIGQGKIEEILSSKGEERRIIFEEAAGVLKYKNRKLKAEKKMVETEDNLQRVEDILHELENQLEPLKRQAAVAKDYLEKKKQLKELEVALIAYDIGALHKKWMKEKEKLAFLEKNKERIDEKLRLGEQQSDELREHIRQLEEKIELLQDNLLETSEELEKKEGQKEVLKEREKNFHQNKEQTLNAINELKEKKQQLLARMKEAEDRRTELVAKIDRLTNELTEKKNSLQMAAVDLEAEQERLKSDYIEVLNEQASLRNEQRYMEGQLLSIEQKRNVLFANNESILQERNKLLDERRRIEQKQVDKEKQLNETIHSYREIQRSLEREKEDYEKRQTKLYEAYQMLQQLRSKKELLVEMQADFAGFFQGVKEVLKARDRKLLHGIIGAIAELVLVPKQYETAVEVALGTAAQHIVVRSEADGRKAIQFLKKNGYGRTTFLPLSIIKGRYVQKEQLAKLKQHRAFIGIAADVIEYDQQFAAVVHNVLGNVIIVEHLEGANELAKLINYSFRIVTLDGDVVNPGGSMTGGALKQKRTPLFSRQRELDELEGKLAAFEEKTNRLENTVKNLRAVIAEKENERARLEKQGEIARQAYLEAKNLLQNKELEVKSINERLSLFDREQTSLENEELQLKNKLNERALQIEQVVTSISLLEQQIAELDEKIEKQHASKETIQAELTDLKIEIAKEKEREVNQNETIARLLTEQKETTVKLEEMEKFYWAIETEMSENSSGEQTLEETIRKNKERKDAVIAELKVERKKRSNLEQQLQLVDKEVLALKQQLQLLFEDLQQCKLQTTKLDVSLDKQLEHLREEYELTYEAANEQFPLKQHPETAREQVKKIKAAIENLGNVNLGAIEEFERVSERYRFLQEQKEDLVAAMKTLQEVIIEMDEEMTKRFKETFTQIRYHFQHVFKKLFGGGKADLLLTNPDELLTTGVEIMASPPGKKLQNLALLSGGERALTAIALLFAILNVRPVPFCVLDEVEAALDEANVSRFANYVKTFSEETQFIVITHRKGTMEEADVLYGVTMQESGVSKLVSVRLEETEELLEV